MRFVDLGAGVGSVLCPLSKARPTRNLRIENAPASWLIAMCAPVAGQLRWHWGSLWQTPLADYDVVYASCRGGDARTVAKVEREMRWQLVHQQQFRVPTRGKLRRRGRDAAEQLYAIAAERAGG